MLIQQVELVIQVQQVLGILVVPVIPYLRYRLIGHSQIMNLLIISRTSQHCSMVIIIV